ncbi:MAG: methyl-accepting chemotaxis protein [Treponema sp.]|nr:methyl-accepting chemotaxis protein [Treponema sp.]
MPQTNNFFIISLIIALGICAFAVLSLVFQLHRAGTASAAGAGFETIKTLFLWGGILNIFIFGLGLSALVFCIRLLAGRQISLRNMVKPLIDQDMKALLRLPKPAPNTGARGSPEARENAVLQETLWSLGKLFESLNVFVAHSAGMRGILQGESRERETLYQHIGEMIDKIAGQFFEIENFAKQAINSLGGIEDYVSSVSSAGENQSTVLEEAGDRLTRASDLSLSVAAQIKDSAGRAETLRDEVSAGEEQAQEVNDIVKAIAQEIEGISEITAIINQISEQTNILSMNAAIESAHAGQAGAGFAVVAEEIRKLAESTRENAGQIHEELVSISKKTKNALMTSQSSFETFSGISGKIGNLSQELADISSAAAKNSAMNGETNTAIKETLLFNRRLKDNSTDVMAHHQSFKAALEQIRTLSDTTRSEIKEIHSGTGELLENTRKSQNRVFDGLEQVEKLKTLPGISRESPADDTSPAPPSAQTAPPARTVFLQAGGIKAAAAIIPEDGKFSDSREVTVKRPPQTII